MKKELSTYQIEAIEKVLPYMERNSGKVLISMPPGTGKSVVIANLFLKYLNSKANIYKERILIIVDRKRIYSKKYLRIPILLQKVRLAKIITRHF